MPKKRKKALLTTRKVYKATAEQRFINRMRYAEKNGLAPRCDSYPKTRPITPTHIDLEQVCRQQDTPSSIHLTCNWETPIFYPANQDISCNESVDTESTSTTFNTHQDGACNVSIATESTSTPFNTHQDVACNVSVDTESTSTPFNTHQDVACKYESVDTEYTSTPFNTHQDVAYNESVDTESNSTPLHTQQDVACNVFIKMEPEPTSLTPNTDVIVNGTSVSETSIQPLDPYTSLRNNLSVGIEPPFLLDPHHKNIHLLQLYQSGNRSVVKTSVTIMEDFTATVNVHGKDISQEHELWNGLPPILYDSVSEVHRLLRCICKYSVCIGNPDVELQDLVPVGTGLTDSDSLSIRAYGEGDFCASKGKISYTSTIRSVKCCLLVEGARCASCSSYRRALRKRKHRQEERVSNSAKIDYLHRRTPHATMSYDMLQQKIKQQKDKIRSLESELDALRKTRHSEIMTNGSSLGEIQSAEMSDLLATCSSNRDGEVVCGSEIIAGTFLETTDKIHR